MYINIHIFVVITTLCFYFVLKSFKNNVTYNEKIESNKKKQSNLIYILFAPISIYLTYYLYKINKNENITITNTNDIITEIKYNPTKDISSGKSLSIYPIESTLSDMS